MRAASSTSSVVDSSDITGAPLPSLRQCAAYVASLAKPDVCEVLDLCRARQRVALQPRCGVGDHDMMIELLAALEEKAEPDLLTVTIDSHTRLKRFREAMRVMNAHPEDLNGYPLVAHGWWRGRQLNESVEAPLQIRHGSPDPRVLFNVSIASGITSFEGGGISYNLPYSKDVPLAESLSAWREVDQRCGDLAELGVLVDREMFGTLTAVLMPPSISLAISVIEAALAAREGVRCCTIAYPQGGHLIQDAAALRCIPELAERYLPSDTQVHPALHGFMGVFPQQRDHAEDLIFSASLTARIGSASKVVTKTYQEAYGIPDTEANVAGLRLSDRANSPLWNLISLDTERVDEEMRWILAEVSDLVDPVLGQRDPLAAVVDSFERGTLDVPFSASRHARSEVIPARDAEGAIRYLSTGSLPFSQEALLRHRELLKGRQVGKGRPGQLLNTLSDDINYFRYVLGEVPEHTMREG
ncbi:methylaspartate mutase [Streptomyces lavendofoliae]|uniref:methylaspartate mutase n=1 Tax=Streptomyces lavendofoliae TaxID=67314 RepID=UPI003D8B50B0